MVHRTSHCEHLCFSEQIHCRATMMCCGQLQAKDIRHIHAVNFQISSHFPYIVRSDSKLLQATCYASEKVKVIGDPKNCRNRPHISSRRVFCDRKQQQQQQQKQKLLATKRTNSVALAIDNMAHQPRLSIFRHAVFCRIAPISNIPNLKHDADITTAVKTL